MTEAQVSTAEVKEVVDAWVDILKIPVISGSYIREDDNFLNIVSTWNADDATKKERLSYNRTFSVLKSSLGDGKTPVISSPGSVTVNEKLAVSSISGRKRSVLVNGTGTTSTTEFLQIWNDGSLFKSYNLEELDLHKQVYTSGGWGITMTWNQSETKVAYLAEKLVPKPKSFHSSDTAPKPDDISKKKVAIGEEYAYRQTWGEQLTNQYFSVVVVCDITTDQFQVLPIPEDQFPTDIQWIGDTHICGTTYPIPIWRLGLIYCSNRESRIFSVEANGQNFKLLTESNRACRSPRVRPDGGYLVWQERILDGAHDRARSIFGGNLTNGELVGNPTVLYDVSPSNGCPVYQDFSRNCWNPQGTTLYAVTPNNSKMICLAFSVSDGSQPSEPVRIDNVDSVLGFTREFLLIGSSSTLTSPQLKLLAIAENYRAITITLPTIPIDFPVTIEYVQGEFSPPAIYHGPAASPAKSIPLIVWPHGGPHSTFQDTYTPEVVLFLKLGFAVVRLNYVGSIGGTRDTADDLMGRIGDRDVKDCQGIVEKILNSTPTLNPEKVVVFGGSHGGFLSCHLSCQYPDVYKAAVMRNPVTDLNTLVGTSDITDWTYAESGVNFPEYPVATLIPTARNLDDSEKYIKASPIHLVERVKAATLLLLGSEDLRVPAQQGLGYYRALRAYNKVAEVRMYPDNHPLGTAPVRLDSIIQSALWFKKYLS